MRKLMGLSGSYFMTPTLNPLNELALQVGVSLLLLPLEPSFMHLPPDRATDSENFNLHKKGEIATEHWLPAGPLVIGITAGASCPNNLIEETILRVYELRGVPAAEIMEVSAQLTGEG